MIKWIKSLLAKKKPELYWGEFKEWDYCSDCNHMQELYFFMGVCPECGSRHIKKVVGRWQSCNKSFGGFVKITRVKCEVKQ